MTDAPPRFLLRRALAFGLDHALATLLVALAFLPLAATGLRPPPPLSALRGTVCTDLATPPGWLAEGLSDPRYAVLRLCENRFWGRPNGQELIAVYAEIRPDGSRVTSLSRTPVGPDLQPTGLPDLSAAAVLALMAILSAALTARGWPTPGKALARLRVTGAHPWRREALRLGPLALLAALPALIPLQPLDWPFAAILGGVALIALSLTWYYLWPFAHWSGQSRHGRLSGTRVSAATAAPAPPPGPR